MMLSFLKSLFGISDDKGGKGAPNQRPQPSQQPQPWAQPSPQSQLSPQDAQALADAQAETPQDRLNLPRQTVLDRAASETDMKNQVFDSMLRPNYKSWSMDMDEGVIYFDCGDRLLSSRVQIAGTYDSTDGTFLWSWDNPSIPAEMTKAALLVKQFGEKHGIDDFKNAMVKCDYDMPSFFNALASYLYGGQATFEGNMAPQRISFVLDEISIRKQ